ncbi:UDP-N-acetylmuramoylalanyl-D-glutamyl-2,6-diaminopimelate/D-alanyl-D-alanyl ligase [Clostridium bornimense]|uniref:UDP-N-acetylmuramoyl-tripeptide--D-alanyl-D-alanine ligase n=1 Tax=Clostridium bornimense TaxID=1216932 RepID=W6RYS2_9CLOT|nr:UDP-N-acetylmuramoyl-tripeptide--D-alanyl-D-alanine ligase [Clostridium bornimense]CDM68764.1 UDP-N-acetylmuramoylalanyl-D-glutamyl-2,6-diaminopimelate/D-alanyl-D-alanyl ligase [Clostridium bornimense]
MENLSFNEILEAVNGRYLEYNGERKITYVETDTRKIKEGALFIALKGENFNGNKFADVALENGASAVIIDEIAFDVLKTKGLGNIIIVEDTRKALLDLAAYYRRKLDIKVVGITGSTGKTSTKDLVAAALSSKYKVFKTKGNFNNEVGVPLMIFSIDNSYDIAVLEMGMSNLGEIERLALAGKPDIAVITNVGMSHIENLKTRENILKAKMEITTGFNKENVLIINGENDLLKTISRKDYEVIKIGADDDYYDIKAKDIKICEDSVEFTVDESSFLVEQLGYHSVLNGLLAIAVGRKLGLSDKEINKGFKNIESTSMRLDVKEKNNNIIINDTYNASPDSMKAGIDVLMNLKKSYNIIIVGDMRELGDESYNAHKNVGEYAKEKGIDLLLTTGEYSRAYKDGFGESTVVFEDKESIVNYVKALDKNYAVLVKASRGSKFEEIVNNLI